MVKRKNRLMTDSFREVRNTFGRFLSILVLSGLAVAFLSGLRAAAPDMQYTADRYFDRTCMMDGYVLSTLGITEEDLQALSRADGVETAEGGKSLDATAVDSVVSVCSLPERLNLLELREGRLPSAEDECVTEALLLTMLGLRIGDQLDITLEEGEDGLRRTSFTVVGVVDSPLYVGTDRGSSSLGNGSVNAIVYVPMSNFNLDVYTIAYFTGIGLAELDSYGDEYEQRLDALVDSLEGLAEERAELRYQAVMSEAQGELDEARRELEEARAEVEQELADAEKKLAEAREELDKGWKEYYDGLDTLDRELTEAGETLDSGLAELKQGELDYQDGLTKLREGKKTLADAQAEYEAGLAAFLEGKAKYESGLADYLAGKAALEDAEALYEQGLMEYEASLRELEAAEETYQEGLAEYESGLELYQTLLDAGIPSWMLTYLKNSLDEGKAELDAGRAQLDEGWAQLEDAGRLLDDGWDELVQGRAELAAAEEQLTAAEAEILAGEQELSDAKKLLDDGLTEMVGAEQELAEARKQLDDGWKEYETGAAELTEEEAKARAELADAKKLLDDGELEYADGFAKLEEGRAEAEEELADAEAQLADAQEEIGSIEECKWYVLGRDTNAGFVGYGQDTGRVSNLAKIFPIIFFLVAALACLTTMTRMVEEQRTQIGGLKAMGFSRLSIAGKYLGYAFFASLIGGLLGLALGCTVIPLVIANAFNIMYHIPPLEFKSQPGLCAVAVAAAVACTTGAALWACLSTLVATPANLMRPKAPKAGKRVLLERIPVIWSKLTFTWKVTVRNLFRYQKRFWMTVIGIGGCTALIVTGFGLHESIFSILDQQFDVISCYDAVVGVDEGISAEEWNSVEQYLGGSPEVERWMSCYQTTMDASAGGVAYSTSVYSIRDEDVFRQFMNLRHRLDEERVELSDEGAVITEKLSELLDVRVGDTIVLDGDKRVEVPVADITEHYVMHNVYLTEALYTELFGAPEGDNALLLTYAEGDESAESDRVSTALMGMPGVVSYGYIATLRDSFTDSMVAIDYAVIIIILSAAALAFVVLYNLTNINITERTRELATLKVLGFYDRETSAYVYRENIFLTVFGIALGLVLGRLLHGWMVVTVEVDIVMFGRVAPPYAYILAALLTVVFSVVVNIVAHYKLKKVDMVESLKSVE